MTGSSWQLRRMEGGCPGAPRRVDPLQTPKRAEAGGQIFNPFKPQYQPPCDPNAMDTSADRTQVRQIEVEPEEEHVRVHEEGDPNREGPAGRGLPFPPKARFLKKRWEQKDKQGVQCYNCQKYRHITKECFQK